MGNRKIIEVDIKEVVHHTDKALLVQQEDGTEAWVPIAFIQEFKGMMSEEIEIILQDEDALEIITIPEWLAVQKGLV
jgi:hypothetical protein